MLLEVYRTDNKQEFDQLERKLFEWAILDEDALV